MSSRASRTAAMMDAAITSVEAKRSCARRSCSSRAIALRISPTGSPPRHVPDGQQVRKHPWENLCGQVAPSLTAQRAFSHDPRIRHGLNRGRDVLSASFTTDDGVGMPRLGQVPHGNSIGEEKAKICTGSSPCGDQRIVINFGRGVHSGSFLFLRIAK